MERFSTHLEIETARGKGRKGTLKCTLFLLSNFQEKKNKEIFFIYCHHTFYIIVRSYN